MDWGTLGPIVSAVFFVTTLIASAIAGLATATWRTVRITASDLRERNADLEKERSENREAISKLTGEVELLTEMVTGRVEWVAVSDLLEQHHTEANGHWTATEEYLGQILGVLRGSEQA